MDILYATIPIGDPQFGRCVMFVLRGSFTESLNDVCLRVDPIEMYDALEMMNEIKNHRILDAVDREAPGKSLMALGTIGLEHKQIREIDVNPMIVRGSLPVAADALVVLRKEEYP